MKILRQALPNRLLQGPLLAQGDPNAQGGLAERNPPPIYNGAMRFAIAPYSLGHVKPSGAAG
jgi:hypothetical protein